ncbi:MAG: hypothetical protein QM770_21175 [Tepidisphaeraceae bacterium]
MIGITSSLHAAPNLVPETPNRSPDYFCTWNVQGYACSYANTEAQRAAMIEASMFGQASHQDWLGFFPDARRDLYFVMDDSWDVPLRDTPAEYGSLMLNAERFPSYAGEPAQRLTKLRSAVQERGWRGLGGWVCAQQAPAHAMPDDDAYWTERLRWMRDAGIAYWKVDWGKRDRDADWRNHLTDLARREAPDLVIEHALAEGSLKQTAVYRTYDVENVVAAPVTIDRVATLLRHAPAGSPTVINCEDEPYIAAGTGCALGVMRHPFAGPLPGGRADFCFPATCRDLKHRLDEVTRVVRWHRLAAPLAVGGRDAILDENQLRDFWTLAEDETWTAYRPGDRREATAPARIARGGLALPDVRMDGQDPSPFVLACRSPHGPVAIATVGRTRDRAYTTPRAHVRLDVGPARTIGVFGVYGSLTLDFDKPLTGQRVFAQDLKASESTDITDRVTVDGKTLTLPGDLLARIGTSAASPGDVSEPGLLLVIRE